jgi:hypothetical protein
LEKNFFQEVAVMDENKEKEELNDELLEQVSGGNVFTDPPKFVPEARPKKPQG